MAEQRFDETLKAQVSFDNGRTVRTINHVAEPFQSTENTPLRAAIDYVQRLSNRFGLHSEQLSNLEKPVCYLDPAEKEVDFGLQEERQAFDSHTYAFAQTYMNIPVWESGVKVTCKDAPCRIVSAVNTSEENIKAKLPSRKVINSYRKLFPRNPQDVIPDEVAESPAPSREEQAKLIHEVLGVSSDQANAGTPLDADARIIRGRFYVYKYTESERTLEDEPSDAHVHTGTCHPTLPLPEVHEDVEEGAWYVVAEITFSYSTPEHDHMNWRMLVDLKTSSVLYLRALSGCVSGSVFRLDPISATGDATLTSDQGNSRFNPLRDDVTLTNLDPPSGGLQSLRGKYVKVVDVHSPNIAAPTESTGTDFDYDVRTNDYAAVCAYFHTNQVFEVIESLGFRLGSYFSHTNFPIQVDHRGMGGIINAHCVGDGLGGISHSCYGIMDNTNTAEPLGRACDPRVHWHELCGHGILYESVDGPNFRFSHSAGDGISGIFFDPDSNAPGAKRFEYVPWHPTLRRRFDRNVASGWAWGGVRDNGGYGSEEILATCHFRIYQSIGGDSPDPARKRFASRMAMYLILRAIGNLTPASNPRYAREFADELMAVDRLNWTSEGVTGGAYNKVIRWSFEKQGEYQSPPVTRSDPRHGTITNPGAPPNQDVYIDDGRQGEYEYQHIHWNTTTIWNRRSPDGVDAHQSAALGSTNYAYVKIKNRGTQTATGVVVRAFHCRPSAGLLWPVDLQPMTTAKINVGTIGGNNTEEKVVGPFKWTPIINAHGHDCMLMVVTSDEDPANIDSLIVGELVSEWRLVPNDNNIAQRNVVVIPSPRASVLKESLSGKSFWVRNPKQTPSKMKLESKLPKVLAEKGWKLVFEGIDQNSFRLQSGEEREVSLQLQAGDDFTATEIAASSDQDIVVFASANEMLIGGMTYRLDPTAASPEEEVQIETLAGTQELIKSLKLTAEDITRVRVKKLTVDIEFE